MVHQIRDVVEETLSLQAVGVQRGVLGAAVIQGRVTEVLDVAGLVRAHDPSFGEGRAE